MAGSAHTDDASWTKTANHFFTNLRCRECGRSYPKQAIHICEFDFGPLEAAYDYEAIARVLTRERIASAAPDHVALPRVAAHRRRTDRRHAGRLHAPGARRLASRGGSELRELYIKNDTVNYPTLSFKDRVVSVALSRARELGLETGRLRLHG